MDVGNVRLVDCTYPLASVDGPSGGTVADGGDTVADIGTSGGDVTEVPAAPSSTIGVLSATQLVRVVVRFLDCGGFVEGIVLHAERVFFVSGGDPKSSMMSRRGRRPRLASLLEARGGNSWVP